MKANLIPILCELEGRQITDADNNTCSGCCLYLNTCKPIAGSYGYALGSESDCYLCSSCSRTKCPYSFL